MFLTIILKKTFFTLARPSQVMNPSSFSSSSSSSSVSYPSPEPPIILPEDYQENGRPTSSGRSFLSSEPARDSTIEVHTLQHEYQLHVRLPGFSWDGITLATKRKRILHVVADRWDHGGGERLIHVLSFWPFRSSFFVPFFTTGRCRILIQHHRTFRTSGVFRI